MPLLDCKLPQNGYYENSNFPCEYGVGPSSSHIQAYTG